MEKLRILTILRPHMFFDDQISHLESPASDIPMVHIPFGIANRNLEIPVNAPVASTVGIEEAGLTIGDNESSLLGQLEAAPASDSRDI